jgi:hypothetical protein
MTEKRAEAPPGGEASPRTAPVVMEDVWGYRIAVAGVGAALVAFLIGAALIAAGGNPVPTQYWSVGSGLAGGLLGILAPTPTKAVVTDEAKQTKPFISHLAAFASDIWNNRAVVLLLALFIVSVIFAAKNNSPELDTLAAAAGGALVGLLGPSPTSKQGG